MRNLDDQQLKALCDVIADTSQGYTKNQLKKLLKNSNIEELDDGSFNSGYVYRIGLKKSDWLYECLLHEKKIKFFESYL